MTGKGIPKIHRTKTRKTLETLARKLAEMDGYKATPTAFHWLQIEPYLRDTVNPRSVHYMVRAIEVYKIMKSQG